MEFLDHIIPGADDAVSSAFRQLLEKQGFTCRLSTKVVGARTRDPGVPIDVEGLKDGAAATVAADVVLAAVGRRLLVGT